MNELNQKKLVPKQRREEEKKIQFYIIYAMRKSQCQTSLSYVAVENLSRISCVPEVHEMAKNDQSAVTSDFGSVMFVCKCEFEVISSHLGHLA